MEIATIGVVGAGTMGTGLAEALATTGHRVVLVDCDPEALGRARTTLRRNLRLHRMFGCAPADPAEATLERVTTTCGLDALGAADFIIENVTESWEVKRELYPRLDAACGSNVVFGVNTSALSITRVAAETRRPERMLGMHFMNPVALMPVVELVRGWHTGDDTLSVAKRVVAQMGKECIVVHDSPGFVTNRVMMLTVNEAMFLVHESVAPPEDVDRLFKTCFGHKMGPLETADLIGLDTVLYSLEVIRAGFSDDKYRPCPLLKKMVAAGLLGRKSGRGFYDYRLVQRQAEEGRIA
jgi:3-hydroxybutyryl-CoA dehydrogenase